MNTALSQGGFSLTVRIFWPAETKLRQEFAKEDQSRGSAIIPLNEAKKRVMQSAKVYSSVVLSYGSCKDRWSPASFGTHA